jgi:GNAT superfamily N-acetyltransferase
MDRPLMPPPAREATIRLATTADIPALAALAADAFRDTYRGIDADEDIESYIAKHFHHDELARQLADPASTMLLAAAPDRLLGYSQVKRSEVPACVTGPAPVELARLYLCVQAKGQGLGGRLMRAVQAEARRLDRQTLWLGVYDRNVHAIAFYQRFGFATVGHKGFEFGGRIYMDPVMAAPVPLAA